jgi:hypothetical protein
VVLFATSQRIGVMASSFSDADLAQAAMLFAAFVLAIPRGDMERPEEIRADAWYAALLAGIAVGVKVSAAPAALVGGGHDDVARQHAPKPGGGPPAASR